MVDNLSSIKINTKLRNGFLYPLGTDGNLKRNNCLRLVGETWVKKGINECP